MHNPIRIENLCLYFSQKVCFERFNALIHPGDRIAIIGRNGTGKSSLLKLLNGRLEPSEGRIVTDPDIRVGYVSQTVQDYNDLSGGERFNKALSAALSNNPDVLLLDEPTNHLDLKNRKALLQMLRYYSGTLILVSHDVELLRETVDILWRIDEHKIAAFSGNFDDYIQELDRRRLSMENELSFLSKEKRAAHQALMKEQQRAKNSRVKGETGSKQGKWPPIIAGGKKRQAQHTAGKKKQNIGQKRQEINEQLDAIRLPEIILPSFSLTAEDIDKGTILLITNGQISYGEKVILKDINFSLGGDERMAIVGDNASGKTTLLKALLEKPEVAKSGDWLLPKPNDIGYLDQHYSNLDPGKTVLESVQETQPGYTHRELRTFLNDFLFRKNEEVNARVSVLSGGERARLSLALIAAKTPRLLILDEITNNVDLETKEHLIEVLRQYPGAVIAVSHEPDFLNKIGVNRFFYTTKQ